MQSRYRNVNGSRPEDQLRSGDVAVYFNVPEEQARENAAPPMTAMSAAPKRPAVYERALQGFGHAVLIAKDDQRIPYHLDSPMLLSCSRDFRGKRPYIVLRPRAKITKNRRFSANVDLLVRNFREIGYQYDASFRTDILEMSPQKRIELQSDILNWSPSLKKKPKIPDMYCSELITTIYMMLGVPPKTDISGGELLDRGFAKDLADGKPPEAIASESAHDIIEYFKFGYQMQVEEKQSLIAPENKGLLKRAEVSKVTREIEQTKDLIRQLGQNEALLRDLLRSRLGLNIETDPSSSSVVDAGKSVAYFFANQKRLVRPVDLLREAMIQDGSFDVVGYYAGDMKSTCDPAQLDLAPLE